MNRQKTALIPVFSPEDRNVYVGAWIGGFWDNNTKKLNVQPVTAFEKTFNKKLAFVTLYSEWAYLANKQLLTSLGTIDDNGWVPIISTNPYFFSGCQNSGISLYATIASGKCDMFLQNMAKNLASFKKPIFLRFAWEMNLPDMYWSIGKTNSTPEEFIASWRHMHDIFAQNNANNVQWVLSFNTSSSTTVPYKKLYPGDAYVDWVAIDGYNWGNTHSWSRWTDFNGVFRNSYNELTSISNKPIMLSEVNSSPTGTGGSKSVWLHDMLTVQVPEKFPKIDAIIFFNEDKSKTEKVDWRIETSVESIAVIKTDLQKPLYKSDYK